MAVELWQEIRPSARKARLRVHPALRTIGDHRLKLEHLAQTDGIMLDMILYMPPLRIHLVEARGQCRKICRKIFAEQIKLLLKSNSLSLLITY